MKQDEKEYKYEDAKEVIGHDFSENDIVGYDISNGARFPIVANCWCVYDNTWWFGCDAYDYVYSLNELADNRLVELV